MTTDGPERRKRARGGKISLTAHEAAWVYLILDTSGEIAMDTLPYVDLPMPLDPYAAWDRIIQKIGTVCPAPRIAA